jgi:hypothetical protein
MARTENEPEFSPLPESALDDSETSSVQSPQPPPVSKNPTPVSPQTLADHVYRSLSNVPQMNTRSSDGNSGRDEPRRASESIGGSTGRPDKPPASSIPHHMGRMVSGPHIGSKTSGSLTADMVSRAGSSAGPVQHSSKGKAKMIMSSKERLKKEEQGVVKRRDGGVLARGFILKTDHYPTGEFAYYFPNRAVLMLTSNAAYPFSDKRKSPRPRLSSRRRSQLASTTRRITQRIRCRSTNFTRPQGYSLRPRLSPTSKGVLRTYGSGSGGRDGHKIICCGFVSSGDAAYVIG